MACTKRARSTSFVLTCAALLGAWLRVAPAAASETPLQAVLAITSMDFVSSEVSRTCFERGGSVGGQAVAAYLRWRAFNQVDVFRQQALSWLPRENQTKLAQAASDGVAEQMRLTGLAQGCMKWVSRWRGRELDMRSVHPAGYDGNGNAVRMSTSDVNRAIAARHPPPAPAQPTATQPESGAAPATTSRPSENYDYAWANLWTQMSGYNYNGYGN